MQHQKAGNLLKKDQARRMRYQEQQRIKQKLINAPNTGKMAWESNQDMPEGQLKSFASKLIK